MSAKIFEELRKDHDIQRDLLDILASTSGDSEGRRSMYKKLKNQLEEHAKYEERYFYAALMKHDITMDKARHSVHEHHEIDEKLEDLDDIAFNSPQWLSTLKDLKDLVIHHLDEEEQEVFQLAGKALKESEKETLGKNYSKTTEGINYKVS